ncbi:MAG: hypothetical protein M1404_03485 [Acidobacteria bacterium]|nr:hypothetical protein [Acidobacteriota bacterium]
MTTCDLWRGIFRPVQCYRIIKKEASDPFAKADTALPISDVIENKFYRVKVDPESGAIKSIYDKELQRELVDTASPCRLNQHVYVPGDGPLTIKSAEHHSLDTSTISKLISVYQGCNAFNYANPGGVTINDESEGTSAAEASRQRSILSTVLDRRVFRYECDGCSATECSQSVFGWHMELVVRYQGKLEAGKTCCRS